MAEEINLSQVWDDKTFRVHKGKLRGLATLKGRALGNGLIYCVGQENIRHLIAGELVEDSLVLSSVEESLKCVWNPGAPSEFRNVGKKAADLLRVNLKFRSNALKALPKATLAAASSLMMNGEWSDQFKKSVEVDLQAIGNLVLALNRNVEPTDEQVLCAKAAQADLEFKLRWIVKSFRKLRQPLHLLHTFAWYGDKEPDTRLLVGNRAEPPYDGSVRVTVNTKDQDGTKDVAGCEVWWNFSGYGNTEKYAERFGQFSTPTSQILPVGEHNMWTKKTGIRGERSKVGVGLAGETEQTVDLLAPQS